MTMSGFSSSTTFESSQPDTTDAAATSMTDTSDSARVILTAVLLVVYTARLRPISEAGENLAKGFHSSAGVVTAWMNSPEHRQNVLDGNYTDVGFAVQTGEFQGKKTTLVVALYGEPTTSAVQASAGRQVVLAAHDDPLSPIARLGVGLQSMTPALLGSLVLLVIAGGVALSAHAYRNKLPREWRLSWKKHHGLYKAVGMASLAVVLLALYGGGQV